MRQNVNRTPIATRCPASFAAIPRVMALALLLFVTACSGLQSEGPLSRPQPDIATPARYAAAVRLAALARVEARAGQDEAAAEHFRAAYRQLRDPAWLLLHARSAERVKQYAEAVDSLRQALDHGLSDEERQLVGREIERLRPLIAPGLVRVVLQVDTPGARVELSRPAATGGGQSAVERVVLGSGAVYLPAGLWTAYTVAKGYQSELRTLQVQADGGDWLAIALASEEALPALSDTPRPPPPPAVAQATAAPAAAAIQPAAAIRPVTAPQPPKAATAPASPARTAQQEASGPAPSGDTGQRDPAPRPVAQAQRPSAPAAAATTLTAAPVAPRKGRSAVHSWGPIATTALGVVALGAGGLLGLQATANADAANALRGQGLSKADYTSQFDFYRQATLQDVTMANAAWASGGVLLAAGTLWWLLAPKPQGSALAIEDAPSLGPVAAAPETAPPWPHTPWTSTTPTLRDPAPSAAH
jgi:hypothetical protein